jgi:hypothetical protein
VSELTLPDAPINRRSVLIEQVLGDRGEPLAQRESLAGLEPLAQLEPLEEAAQQDRLGLQARPAQGG